MSDAPKPAEFSAEEEVDDSAASAPASAPALSSSSAAASAASAAADATVPFADRYRLESTPFAEGHAKGVSVFRATRLSDGATFAVKAVSLPPLPRDNKRVFDALTTEFTARKRLGEHPFLLPSLELCWEGPSAGVPSRGLLVMAYARGGCADSRLKDACGGGEGAAAAASAAADDDAAPALTLFPADQVVAIAHNVAAALAHIHAARQYHFDVKPANILFASSERSVAGARTAQLADFGASKVAKAFGKTSTKGVAVGTEAFMAPEMLARQGGKSSADIWSLGATLLALLTGRELCDDEALVAFLVGAFLREQDDWERVSFFAPESPSMTKAEQAAWAAAPAPLRELIVSCLALKANDDASMVDASAPAAAGALLLRPTAAALLETPLLKAEAAAAAAETKAAEERAAADAKAAMEHAAAEAKLAEERAAAEAERRRIDKTVAAPLRARIDDLERELAEEQAARGVLCDTIAILAAMLKDELVGAAGAKNLAAIVSSFANTRSLSWLWNVGAEGAPVLAVALPRLKVLTTLNLSKNTLGDAGITALATALPSLKALKTLDVHCNSIGVPGITALAATLPSVVTLTSLVLGSDTLPSVDTSSDLQTSNRLGAAGASALATALPSLTALENLHLGANFLGDAGAIAIAAAIPSLPALASLNLLNNSILEAGMIALAAALHSATALKMLQLGANAVGDRGITALAATLPHLKALATLGLSSYVYRNPYTNVKTGGAIGETGAVALSAALPLLPSLKTLDLSGSRIGTAGTRALAAAFHFLPFLTSFNGQDCLLNYNEDDAEDADSFNDECRATITAALPSLAGSLTTLNLSGNYPRGVGMKTLAIALPTMLLLKELNLSGNCLDSQDAIALATALPSLASLISFNIGQIYGDMCDTGVAAIVTSLSSLKKLTMLDLSNISFGVASASALVSARPCWNALTELNMQYNKMGPSSAVAFAEALTTMTALTRLNLYDNDLGDVGVIALSAALPSMKALAVLNLHANYFGNDGVIALAAALPSLPLTSLSLPCGTIGDAGAASLAAALPSLPLLTHLELREHQIGDAGAFALAATLPSLAALKALGITRNRYGNAAKEAIHSAVRKGWCILVFTRNSLYKEEALPKVPSSRLEEHSYELSFEALATQEVFYYNVVGVRLSDGFRLDFQGGLRNFGSKMLSKTCVLA